MTRLRNYIDCMDNMENVQLSSIFPIGQNWTFCRFVGSKWVPSVSSRKHLPAKDGLSVPDRNLVGGDQLSRSFQHNEALLPDRSMLMSRHQVIRPAQASRRHGENFLVRTQKGDCLDAYFRPVDVADQVRLVHSLQDGCDGIL